MKQLDMNIVFLINAFFVVIFYVFVMCFFGKSATESFEKMSDSLYESNWQELSIDLQKSFILMIQNTQRPLFYHGFGVCILDLETFAKVSVFFTIFIH